MKMSDLHEKVLRDLGDFPYKAKVDNKMTEAFTVVAPDKQGRWKAGKMSVSILNLWKPASGSPFSVNVNSCGEISFREKINKTMGSYDFCVVAAPKFVAPPKRRSTDDSASFSPPKKKKKKKT